MTSTSGNTVRDSLFPTEENGKSLRAQIPVSAILNVYGVSPQWIMTQ